MTNHVTKKTAALAVFALGLFAHPQAAFAGFQWVEPTELANPSGAAGGGFESMPPLVVDGKTTDASLGIVAGFANQVPLAVALRQILPAGYGFSVDPDVDAGVLVSFRGGKPWRETLKDTVDPLGLSVREDAQMVAVGRLHPVSSVPSVPPVAALDPVLDHPVPAVLPPAQPEVAQPVIATATLPAPAPVSVSVTNPGSLAVSASAAPALVGPSDTHLSKPDLAAVTVEPHKLQALPSAVVVQSWDANRGDSLQKVLADWSRRAHVEFNWLAEYDYPLQASVHIGGTYQDAVRKLLSGFEGAHPQPIARLHMNPEIGQMAIVIETRGNSYTN